MRFQTCFVFIISVASKHAGQLKSTRERHVLLPRKNHQYFVQKRTWSHAFRNGRRWTGCVLYRPLVGLSWGNPFVQRLFYRISSYMGSHSSEKTDWDDADFPMRREIWIVIASRLKLSKQQKRIVELLLRANKDKQIACAMSLSVPTVRTYLKRIFERTQTTDRLSLILKIFAMAQEFVSRECH